MSNNTNEANLARGQRVSVDCENSGDICDVRLMRKMGPLPFAEEYRATVEGALPSYMNIINYLCPRMLLPGAPRLPLVNGYVRRSVLPPGKRLHRRSPTPPDYGTNGYSGDALMGEWASC